MNLDAVRQLIDGVKRYGCERGLLVTNSFLTEQAAECATAWGIEVWDRRTLGQYVDGDASIARTNACAECGHRVTPGVQRFCLSRPARFGERVYCMRHQARSPRRAG